MSIKEDEVKSGRLVYSCNCGWIDTGHANPNSTQAFTGAKHLWEQISKETGRRSRKAGVDGFKVTFAQKMGLPLFGFVLFRNGVTNEYFVRGGLSTSQKESVALAIFAEVSAAFEAYQGLTIIAANSSFSQEDIISDLIGFYKAVRPETDYGNLCNTLGTSESLEVFKQMSSSDRDAKSASWDSPVFYACKICPKGTFPKEYQAITPAAKGGKDPQFRDWTDEDTFGPLLPLTKIMFMVQQNRPQGPSKSVAMRGDAKVRPQAMAGKNVNI